MAGCRAKVGRPTKYSKQVALAICTRLAEGEPLTKICRDDSMPALQTVYMWLSDGRHTEFLDMYTRAREDQADTLADQIIEIADDGSHDTKVIEKDGHEIEVIDREWVERSKLRVEARKWVAAKLKPRKYSDTRQDDKASEPKDTPTDGPLQVIRPDEDLPENPVL